VNILETVYNISSIDKSYSRNLTVIFDRIVIKINTQPTIITSRGTPIKICGSASYASDGAPVPSGAVVITDGANLYPAKISSGQFCITYIPNVSTTVTFYAVSANDYPDTGLSLQFGSSYGFVDVFSTDYARVTIYAVAPQQAQAIGVSSFLARLGVDIIYTLIGAVFALGIFAIMAKIYDWSVAGALAMLVLFILFALAGYTGQATFALILMLIFVAIAFMRS
jgi:hypothetical protein